MGIESVPTSRPVLAAVAYAIGRGAGRLSPAVSTSSSSIAPLAGGAAIGALWGTVHGLINLNKYKKREISKQQAVRNTANESVGFGVATATGIAVANVLRATALVGSSVALVPFVVATAATGGTKMLWDRLTRNASIVGPDDDHGAEDLNQEPEPEASTVTF